MRCNGATLKNADNKITAVKVLKQTTLKNSQLPYNQPLAAQFITEIFTRQAGY